MTALGAPASLELAEPTAVPREAAQRVFDYMIFHKSLLGEAEETPKLLDRYMTLVKELKDGVHVVIDDPFQKATALLFELVMDEAFDPWEIDLVRFTQVYLERMGEEGALDFAVAGRLVYMAWSILYLQSKELLTNRDRPAEAVPLGDPALADDGYIGDLETPEALDVTSAVLGGVDTPPLTEMVRHPETRPVSLLEIVQAFGEAEEEARRSLKVQELRDRLREQQRSPPEVLVHGDIPEHDLADTWTVALTHPLNEPFPFLSLWRPGQGRDRLVALFLASLFLAREQAIDLRQESLGSSPIELVRAMDARAPVREE
ncbi:MAG: hypothetical protein ACHQ2Y_00445 [Candidatus Lutacidiplasmatales archaeon]